MTLIVNEAHVPLITYFAIRRLDLDTIRMESLVFKSLPKAVENNKHGGWIWIIFQNCNPDWPLATPPDL